MHKKIAFTALAFAIIIPASTIFAEESVSEINVKEQSSEQAKKDLETAREQKKQLTENTRETNKQALETQREISKQTLETQREAGKQQLETLKKQKRLEFENKKEKMTEERCKDIENKLTTRAGRYENNGKMLENVYGHMQERLTRLLERLSSKGIDVTKLTADIKILDGKIAKLYADHANLMISLQASKSFACDGTEGEFKGRIENARKVPEIIKQDREDIKKFFQTTIKADLLAIRKTLPEQKIETPEVETEKVPTTTPAVAPTL